MATGHNLDDEAARLLGNVLHWQSPYLAVQSPVLEVTHPRWSKRSKPLYRLSEYETAAYAFLRGIDYIVEECPFSHDAIQLQYKGSPQSVGACRSPAPSTASCWGSCARGASVCRDNLGHLKECPSCGYPTTGEVCGFCRLQGKCTSQHGPGGISRDTRGRGRICRRETVGIMCVDEASSGCTW